LDGAPFASVEAGADGTFSLDVSTDLAPGPHRVSASAEVLGVHSAASVPRSFDVVTPADGGVPDAGVDAGVDAGADAGVDAGGEAPAAFQVGCGCGASSGAGVGIVALLLGVRATRRRRTE
jgi:hypothetical protein